MARNMARSLAWALVAALLLTVPLAAGFAQASTVRAVTAVTPVTESASLYNRFELLLELDADFSNPYDPDDIRVDAEFRAPDGALVTVPAFWHVDVAGAGDGSWRVRFAPTQVGEWEYRVVATAGGETVMSDWQRVTVAASDNPGFVRVDPRNPAYFAFDDGSPWFAIGQNVAWAVEPDVLGQYELWLDEMAAVGANFVRIWMAPWGFALEWDDTTALGNYDARQGAAGELDAVFEMMEARGIYAMLTLINHGQFSETVNAEWDRNPLNAANGGPLETPADFATNPEAIRLWQQRLRYIAARWSYSTSLMSWEWWNEVEWTALAAPELLAPWIAASTEALRAADPNRHLISHSGSPVQMETVWGQEGLDFTQDHRYTEGDLSNIRRGFANVIPEWLEAYPNKPFLMGEFGTPSQFEPEGIVIHQGLWSAAMLGAAGTGMTWWWDTMVHPNDLYYHFGAIAAFFADEDMGAHRWQPTTATLGEDTDADLFGLQTADRVLLWVLADDYEERYFLRQYQRNLRNRAENPFDVTYPDVVGAQVTVRDLPAGDYVIEIWDAQTGAVLSSEPRTTADGTFLIDLPTFNRDLALKVRPLD
jgi:hypothetical protein